MGGARDTATDDFIMRNPTMKPKEIANILGKNVSTIHKKRAKLGLPLVSRKEYKTSLADSILANPTMSVVDLAKKLGRANWTISRKRTALGLPPLKEKKIETFDYEPVKDDIIKNYGRVELSINKNRDSVTPPWLCITRNPAYWKEWKGDSDED
jgi:hypothetical protein